MSRMEQLLRLDLSVQRWDGFADYFWQDGTHEFFMLFHYGADTALLSMMELETGRDVFEDRKVSVPLLQEPAKADDWVRDWVLRGRYYEVVEESASGDRPASGV